jgi:hypothetical protein
MKNQGKVFEEQFQKSCLDCDMKVLRLPDPPQSFSQDSSALRFSNKNPYDFECYKKPYLFCFELKSKLGKSINFQIDKKDKGKDIKLHQIQGLLNASKYNGVFCGVVFNFRDFNETYYVDIDLLNNHINELNNKNIKSIKYIDIKNIGIIIEQTIKRTKYNYNIKKLIIDIIKINETNNLNSTDFENESKLLKNT